MVVRNLRPVLLFALVLAIAACGSAAPSDAAGGQAQPTANTGGGTVDGGGTGGNSDFKPPDIAVGSFTGGSMKLAISGEYSASLEIPLKASESESIGGVTRLGYDSDSGTAIITIFTDGPLTSFTVLLTDFTTGGQVSDGLCAWEITTNDASKLVGAITCHTTGILFEDESTKNIDIDVTFEANR